ncbi:MAG: hypothetical protein U5R49_04145 [Deltaproteobacteria bacterium]|nr:hypothetical protein [Deltaproteobacteria bacterium]
MVAAKESGAGPVFVVGLSLAGTGATVILPGLYGPTTEVPLLLDRVVLKGKIGGRL